MQMAETELMEQQEQPGPMAETEEMVLPELLVHRAKTALMELMAQQARREQLVQQARPAQQARPETPE